MASLAPTLSALIKSLPPRPVQPKTLDKIVQKALDESNDKVSIDNRKSQWEYLLKNEIFLLAATEGKALRDPETKYYDELRDKLDLVLTFTEHDACEATFPFTVLQDLLETQTIRSCSHIFSWIESRAARLTKGLVPQKGKALVLLRTLNDLLRRLSKMGSTTIFCGRILTFLSGVFPLGERSGVNLRGEYGPTWEGVKLLEKQEEPAVPDAGSANRPEEKGDNMQVDELKPEGDTKKAAPADEKDGFYNTFWSLQVPFSKPPLFVVPGTFPEFKDAVDKVLPAIKEATSKERLMMGSRSTGHTGSLKRKREPESAEESSGSEYFFAKFLTSPDLLALEIADTHFRRQVLFQLLILLNHLLTFTKSAKAIWATPRNRSLQMDFTLEGADLQWVQETVNKATDELRQTAPNGPVFKETVNVVLEREKNWVKWKNELCTPFDREPWGEVIEGSKEKVGMEKATEEARKKMRAPPPKWEWELGTQPLSEIWELGLRDLRDLQMPFQAGDVKDFVKSIKLEDMRIDQRKKQLAQRAERMAQARAKAQAAVSNPSPVKEPSTPKETTLSAPETSSVLMSPSAPLSGARSPLHPSLPAKPGLTSTPSKSGSSQEASSAKAAPATLATPAPAPTLAPAPTPAPVATPVASPAPPAPPTDDQIARFEENKQRWAWLALRTARDQHLQHFGKIGTGDIILLQHEIEQGIEKDKQDREKIQKGEEPSSGGSGLGVGTSAGEEQGASPLTVGGHLADEKMISVEDSMKMEAQEDVKMVS